MLQLEVHLPEQAERKRSNSSSLSDNGPQEAALHQRGRQLYIISTEMRNVHVLIVCVL